MKLFKFYTLFYLFISLPTLLYGNGIFRNVSFSDQSKDSLLVQINYSGNVYPTYEYYDSRRIILLLKDCNCIPGFYDIKSKNQMYLGNISWEYDSLNSLTVIYLNLNYSSTHIIKVDSRTVKIIIIKSVTQNVSENRTLIYNSINKTFKGLIGSIPVRIKASMQNTTWDSFCPVSIDDLAYVTASYWGFDNKVHTGHLIIDQKLAIEVVEIFEELFVNKFPIQQMRLMSEFNGSDDLSMSANNTSCFNCRYCTSSNKILSKHAYGRAIDINPVYNPFVKKNTILPPNGHEYTNRNKKLKGMIKKSDACYNAFIKRGWRWGGDWKSLKDYQHFEK